MSAAIDLSTRKIKIYASAYDGTARAAIEEHTDNILNPHGVTKAQVGLALVDNTSDLTKPVSTAQAAALALKAPSASPAMTGTPTAPTAPVGTISTQLATTAFAYSAANDVVANMAIDDTPLSDHLADVANPHAVTKAQVGLGLADNTSDLTKPVSAAQQTAINVASAAATAAQADIDGHQANVTNPHGVTKAQVGLALVDNTSDLTKPVSTATQAAINAAVAGVDGETIADDLAEHIADAANPHGVTKAQIGLGSVDNTADLAKPVSSAQQTAINVAAAVGAAAQSDIDGHQANFANPHAVTKAQVGLALVDNTADLAKPVSTATQAAINAAVDGVGAGTMADDLAEHIADADNPHAVTKAQIGLANVDNTSDLTKPVSSAQQAAINVAAAVGTAAQADIDGHQANVSNPHVVTKAQIGLANVDNTADLAKPISTATQTALNLKAPLASPTLTGIPTAPTAAPGTNTTQIATTAFVDVVGDSLAAHVVNVTNPHAVTKAQVGLGSVDNTADANKPVSGPQAAALALKAPLASPALTGVPTAPTAAPGTSSTQLATTAFVDVIGDSLTAHAANITNPHGVTKAQVGLGNVDNTADANKPVSGPQAAVLAPLASPALTGVPTAPTAAPGTATTQIATTAYVDAVAKEVQTTLDGSATSPERPGDAVALYGVSATGTPESIVLVPPEWVVVSLAGSVVRVGMLPPVLVEPPVPDPSLPVHVITPASGALVVLTDLRPVYVDTGPLASLTIRLPLTTAGGVVQISFGAPVTALAIQDAAGTPVPESPTNAYGPGAAIIMQYVDDVLDWIHWK